VLEIWAQFSKLSEIEAARAEKTVVNSNSRTIFAGVLLLYSGFTADIARVTNGERCDTGRLNESGKFESTELQWRCYNKHEREFEEIV
jgi:hypothetical protein